MSVTAVKETWVNRRGAQTDTNSDYERVFRVLTDNPLDGPVTVLTAPGIPKLLEAYADANGSVDGNAFCNKREPTQDQDDPTTWLVRCYYTTDVTQSPWLAPPEVTWGTEKYQRPAYAAFNPFYPNPNDKSVTQFVPVINSAGEMFDPPPMFDDSRPTLTVRRNELVYNQAIAVLYQDAVNSDNFAGFAPGVAKMDSITAVSKQAGPITYWEVTYTIHFRREGWALLLLDSGYSEAVPDPNNAGKLIKRLIYDPSGHPVSSQWPLNGVGQKLVLDTTKPINEQLVFLSFNVYKALAFADLRLGV
jgi:hypothetical protein